MKHLRDNWIIGVALVAVMACGWLFYANWKATAPPPTSGVTVNPCFDPHNLNQGECEEGGHPPTLPLHDCPDGHAVPWDQACDKEAVGGARPSKPVRFKPEELEKGVFLCAEVTPTGMAGWQPRKDGWCWQEDRPIIFYEEKPEAGKDCLDSWSRSDGAQCIGGFWYVRENNGIK